MFLSECRPFERVPTTSVSALGSSLMKTYPFSIGGPIFDEIGVHGEHGGLMAAHGGCVFLTMSGTDSKGQYQCRTCSRHVLWYLTGRERVWSHLDSYLLVVC